jgi:RimJ/RimL family protein N-acetyltransferase
LILRQWRPADIEPMARIDGDPTVMRWVGGVSCPLESRQQIDQQAVLIGLRGFGTFAVELVSDGTCIGGVGVNPIASTLPFSPGLQLQGRIVPELQGRGLATEAAAAVVRYCFDILEVDRMAALVVPGNLASIAVTEKLGMSLVGEFDDPGVARGQLTQRKLHFEIRSSDVGETSVTD